MVIGAISWKPRRLTAPARAAVRRERRQAAAAARDTFMDVIVLISVLMFLLLAVGVGLLALQASFTRIPG